MQCKPFISPIYLFDHFFQVQRSLTNQRTEPIVAERKKILDTRERIWRPLNMFSGVILSGNEKEKAKSPCNS